MLFVLVNYGCCILYELKKPGGNISSFSDFRLIMTKTSKADKKFEKIQ